ncbi:MAG: DUF1850 domain-containing protein [Burkholderiales bacterium]
MACTVAGVCLALALAPSAPVFVPTSRFTLAWMHSIEQIRWEEDYAVGPDPAGAPGCRLLPGEARIHGSGAGMDPPPDAHWRDGWYAYQPHTPPLRLLRLTRSPYTADYDWCVDGRCRSLSRVLPSDGGVTLLWACSARSEPPPP